MFIKTHVKVYSRDPKILIKGLQQEPKNLDYRSTAGTLKSGLKVYSRDPKILIKGLQQEP